MKGLASAHIILLLATSWAFAQNPPLLQPPPQDLADQPIPLFILPEADVLLSEVRARLPQESLQIQATTGTRLTNEYRKLHVHTILEYGAAEPMAQYAMFDNFGTLRETMQVRFTPGAEPSLYHYLGEDQTPNPDFKPEQLIKDLSFGWNELSLAFLWWKNGKTIDRGRTKARETFIVDIPVPDGVTLPYVKIRVHIDQKEKFIYKAIAYDAKEKPVREIEANRLMKIDGLWMVKDIEIKAWPGPVKTVVTINDVQRDNQPVEMEQGRPAPDPAP